MAESDRMFDSLNNYGESLAFLESPSAAELQKMIQSIRLPVRIIAIYALGVKHYAWIQTSAKVIKKTKEGK